MSDAEKIKAKSTEELWALYEFLEVMINILSRFLRKPMMVQIEIDKIASVRAIIYNELTMRVLSDFPQLAIQPIFIDEGDQHGEE